MTCKNYEQGAQKLILTITNYSFLCFDRASIPKYQHYYNGAFLKDMEATAMGVNGLISKGFGVETDFIL